MSTGECCAAFRPSVKRPTQAEIKLWEDALAAQGLSMDAGSLGGHRLDYGARYFDVSEPFSYAKPDTNARQKHANKTNAEKVLILMETGVSLRAAARRLGLDAGNVCRAIQRYKVNFARCAASGSSEGNNENGEM